MVKISDVEKHEFLLVVRPFVLKHKGHKKEMGAKWATIYQYTAGAPDPDFPFEVIPNKAGGADVMEWLVFEDEAVVDMPALVDLVREALASSVTVHYYPEETTDVLPLTMAVA